MLIAGSSEPDTTDDPLYRTGKGHSPAVELPRSRARGGELGEVPGLARASTSATSTRRGREQRVCAACRVHLGGGARETGGGVRGGVGGGIRCRRRRGCSTAQRLAG